MRLVFTLCLLLACQLTAVAADPAADSFQVTNYKLAFVNVGPEGAVTNEYVPRGETLETWTSLIGVRQWPQTEKLADITGPYVRALQPLLVREAKIYEPEGEAEGTNVIFELYLAPADKSYLEYNLIRFAREEGTEGIKSYQYALKGEYNVEAAVAANAPQLKSRLEVLRGLKLETFQELDESTTEGTADTPTATTTTTTETRTTGVQSDLYPVDSVHVIEEAVVQESVTAETTVTETQESEESEESDTQDEQTDESDASDEDEDGDDEDGDDEDSDEDDEDDEDEDSDDDSDENSEGDEE